MGRHSSRTFSMCVYTDIRTHAYVLSKWSHIKYCSLANWFSLTRIMHCIWLLYPHVSLTQHSFTYPHLLYFFFFIFNDTKLFKKPSELFSRIPPLLDLSDCFLEVSPATLSLVNEELVLKACWISVKSFDLPHRRYHKLHLAHIRGLITCMTAASSPYDAALL